MGLEAFVACRLIVQVSDPLESYEASFEKSLSKQVGPTKVDVKHELLNMPDARQLALGNVLHRY